jgi:hypothetical protein
VPFGTLRSAEEREAFGIEAFPILGEPTASAEPSEGPLHDPALGQDHEAFCPIRSLHDLGFHTREHAGQAFAEFGSLVSCIGVELFQERKHPEQRRHDELAAVTVLDIGRMDQGMKQQAQRVYESMPLLALDLRAGIIAVRIDRGPPFSALFTPSS